MNIAFGSDHAGLRLRTLLAERARVLGYEVAEYGAMSADSYDYPDASDEVVHEVLAGRARFGVLICGTGIGVSIRANRYPGIRAGLCTNVEMARLTREHNDANVLCVGERIVPVETALAILDQFLTAEPSREPRHRNRVEKLDAPLCS